MGVYDHLGVRKRINAAANGTSIGGSIMLPEVVAAMREAGRSYVSMPELLEKAGNRIAELAGVEACYVTNGAAAGVALSVAACMAGSSNARVHQLPGTAGMKDEVIVQRMQINFYELMIRLAGARIVPVGLANRVYPWHLEAAFTPQTAAVVHFPAYSPPTDLPIDQVIELAHGRGVPVIVDAAAEFPPFSILSHYWKLGADLTIFSGGKGLRGPQSSGLILGRKDLVEACAMNSSPNHGVGRPMKVGKEEIVGLLTAVELWSEPEFERKMFDRWRLRSDAMIETLSQVPGVRAWKGGSPPASTGLAVHPDGLPFTLVEWDSERIAKSPGQVMAELWEGDPSIVVAETPAGILLNPATLAPGEAQIVAERVSDVLRT